MEGVASRFIPANPSIARGGDRRRTHADRLLRLEAPDIKRSAGDQEKTEEVDRNRLRRRRRPPHKILESHRRFGLFFHRKVLLETVRNWKRQMAQVDSPVTPPVFRSMNSASRADRLSAEDTIRTRLPISSIRRPNARGAAACAIRAGARMMQSR